MPFYFKLPDLGEGITEGEVVKWLVKPGDEVEEHQVVMEVETDKAIVEVPSPKKGRVMKLGKGEGETVLVGEVLLVIALEGEETPAPAPEEEKEPSVSVVGTLPGAEEVLASPKARALARGSGVDLSHVHGTGPGGAVTEKDVRSALDMDSGAPIEKEPVTAVKADARGPEERVPIKGVRKAIARNLLAAQKRAAFVTGMDEADVTLLWDLRERERKAASEHGVRLTFLPFFIKAVRRALENTPCSTPRWTKRPGR